MVITLSLALVRRRRRSVDKDYIAIADDEKFQCFILNSLIRRDSRFKLLFDATDGQDFIGKLKLYTIYVMCVLLTEKCPIWEV